MSRCVSESSRSASRCADESQPASPGAKKIREIPDLRDRLIRAKRVATILDTLPQLDFAALEAEPVYETPPENEAPQEAQPVAIQRAAERPQALTVPPQACEICGKRWMKMKAFWHSVNPLPSRCGGWRMDVGKTYFARVEVKAQRKGKCEICGKRWMKTKAFWHSVNPFNTRADGKPKSRAEVLADVQAEADAWRPKHCEQPTH